MRPTGPKPTPLAIRIAQGNPGRRPLPANTATVESALPPAPAELDKPARKEWHRVGRLMRDARVISKLDRAALATYCMAWSRWLEAETQVRKHGLVVKTKNGFPQQNPYLPIANKAMHQVMALSAELGLTPSSRSRIHPIADPDAHRDPITDFARRRPARPA